ncbi:MAG TPA: sigma-70 family RNA polymerase sigma factor [Thermoanaerobaculia bacterium]|nr:sigma-70 family RNA polymerase sigma factor [Thermoanaerobaculia bacterium]
MAEKVPPLPEIIAALQAGVAEEENYRYLFDLCYSPLKGFFLRNGCPAEDCLDLIQETFLGIYRGIATFRGEAKFETWLFQIAANAERKARRRGATVKRRGTEVSLDAKPDAGLPEIGETLASSAPGPDEDALNHERSERLHQAVAGLPTQMRRCLILRIDRGLTYSEIGTVLRLSPGTVKSHLFEARHRLQEDLGRDFAALLARGDEADS